MQPTPPVLQPASPEELRRVAAQQMAQARATLNAAADAGERLQLPGSPPLVRHPGKLILPDEKVSVWGFVRGLIEWHGFGLEAATEVWRRYRHELDRMEARTEPKPCSLSDALALILDLESQRRGPSRVETTT